MYNNKKITSYFEKKSAAIPFNPDGNYRYIFSDDHNGDHLIEIINKDTDKLVIKARYSIIGMYNFYNSIWYWGYGIQLANKNAGDKSKVVLNVVDDIKRNLKKYDDPDTLHYIASNSNFYCSTKNIPMVVQLGMYVMNSEWFIEIKYDAGDNIVTIPDKKIPIKKIEYYSIDEIINKGA